jgi:hypothetical protein
MNHSVYTSLFVAFTFLLIFQTAHANIIDDIEKNLEEKRLLRLADVKIGHTIQPFTTDGCSGGLSAGWEFLADKFSSFLKQYGQQPPWQQCCVEHDRAYWQGNTQSGYALRLDADTQLKSCVEQTGIDLAPQLSKDRGDKLINSEKEIILSFRIAAELMYRAVRIGGKPCTPFSWRWGYGWPHCSFITTEK